MFTQEELAAERWLPIAGFDGYEVSDLGRVRSWRPLNGKNRCVHRADLIAATFNSSCHFHWGTT